MSDKHNARPIVVDLAALYQARSERAMTRELELVDSAARLDDLTEFSVLSAFARARSSRN